MSRKPSVSTLVLRMLVRGAAERGGDALPLLASAGVDAAVLDDPDARVPAAAVALLWQELPALLGDDDFGLHMAERTELGGLALVEYVVRNCPDLGAAYRAATRYERLMHGAAQNRLIERGDEARYVSGFSRDAPVSRPDAEHLLAFMLTQGRRLSGIDWAPRAVAFQHSPPRSTATHARLFRAPVAFNQEVTEMVFDRAVLAYPVGGADPSLHALLERHAEERMARLPSAPGFVDQAREVVRESLAHGTPGVRTVARSLRLSQRSFERRLHEEGSSYRELVDAVRRELSIEYLREPGRPLTEVAFLLGFSDTSTFYRAFRRWTGTTPLSYRRRYEAS